MNTQMAFFSGAARQKQSVDVRIEADGGALLVITPYSPHLVEQLKAVIPATDRRWDANKRAWAVSPKWGAEVQSLIRRYFSVDVALPDVRIAATEEVRILNCRYIGATKARGGGDESAYGWSDSAWSIIFPRQVLERWFGAEKRPGESFTLYGVLGVKPDAKAEEVKRAYRRAAMQWHPDRCHEPNAAAQFAAIKDAWDVLGNATLRRKYDIGLRLTASTPQPPSDALHMHVYRPPLRCGYILVRGVETIGRFVVAEILQWEDVVDAQGRTLVASWVAGEDQPREEWVTQ